MNRKRRIVPAWCVALVLMMGMTAATARGQGVLKVVPDDAVAVIKFNNLKQTSDRIAALATKFGIAQQSPAMSDPLGNFKQAIGATNGINETGDAAMVMLAPSDAAAAAAPAAGGAAPAEGEAEAPPAKKKGELIVLLPVSDFKAFLANFADAKTEGEITEVHLPSNPDETAYIAKWGDYAAVSTGDKTPLSKKPAGITPTGLAAKELADKDITIFANMKAIREKALPKLKAQREKIKEKVQAQVAKNPEANEKSKALANSAVDHFLNIAEQFLQQSQAATLGISLGEDAIKPTGLLEFDPKSDWGQSIGQIKNSKDPLIGGIPGDAKYLLVGGYQLDQQAVTKLMDNVLGPINAELAKMGEDGKPFLAYINAFKAYMQATKAGAGGMIAPTGPLGQEALVQAAGIAKGDAAKIIESHREMFSAQQAMMEAMGAKQDVQSSYTANAKTVDGVQLNAFTTTFAPPAAGQEPTPQQMQVQQMMTWMYGPNGMTGYIGAIGADTVVVASGVNDETLAKVIAAAKANDTSYLKQEPVQQAANQLPKERSMVMYVPLDNLARTLVHYAGQFGMNVNVQLPENLVPLGFTVGTEGSAVRADGLIPAETVQSLISAGMQAYMNMQQGRGAGGGQAP